MTRIEESPWFALADRYERMERSGVFRLPVLELGAGNRRDDCDHYAGGHGCLARFIRANPEQKVDGVWTEPEGRCPAGCSSWAAVQP